MRTRLSPQPPALLESRNTKLDWVGSQKAWTCGQCKGEVLAFVVGTKSAALVWQEMNQVEDMATKLRQGTASSPAP